ncbi:MAG: PEGA domain-containing protein [Phycisphaerales bacterium]
MRAARLTLVPLALAPLALTGCLERRIRVTSEPPGALVWLNDREIGRTPVETGFTFHGDYDVRLELDGYEPVHTDRTAHAPVYEWPGIDLVAAALPVKFDNTIEWHFDLERTRELTEQPEQFESGLLDRAEELRQWAITGVQPATAPADN